MFGWFRKPRNLVWTGDVLIDARTDEVLATVVSNGRLGEPFYLWRSWDGYQFTSHKCPHAFITKDGAKKFVEEKFR